MKRQYELPKWKFYNLLMMLGTADDIGRMLKKRGYPAPPRSTIQGWRNRDMLPAEWVPVFLNLALEENYINKIDDLKATWDNP